jgi:hypothetical protein
VRDNSPWVGRMVVWSLLFPNFVLSGCAVTQDLSTVGWVKLSRIWRMFLSAATKLGPYEIPVPIGAGGMGEDRARDPRMGRDVAIEICVERFSDRFSREMHAVAALNRPNICHLYDVGLDWMPGR